MINAVDIIKQSISEQNRGECGSGDGTCPEKWKNHYA
jgi:hypothetical protein